MKCRIYRVVVHPKPYFEVRRVLAHGEELVGTCEDEENAKCMAVANSIEPSETLISTYEDGKPCIASFRGAR